MKDDFKRNYFCFGLGTIGRDMFYTLVSMYMLYYLTEEAQEGKQAFLEKRKPDFKKFPKLP